MPVPGVPGIAAALVEIPKPFPAGSHWFDEFQPACSETSGAAAAGASAHPSAPTLAGLPASGWQAPEHPPAGVCSITAGHPCKGLTPRFGHVVTSLASTPGLAGDGFASCIDTEYSVRALLVRCGGSDRRWKRPGSGTPVPLPNAAPVHHHSGRFIAPGCCGQILARRVRNAWLAARRRRQLAPAHTDPLAPAGDCVIDVGEPAIKGIGRNGEGGIRTRDGV